MRVFAGLILLVFTLLTRSAATADAPKDEKPKDAPKVEAKGDEVSFRGHLSPKEKDAPADVVAVFTVSPKKFEVIAERKPINVFAKGEMARQLLALAADSAKVQITGTTVNGGICVTKVELLRKKNAQVEVVPIAPGTVPVLPRGDENF